LQNNSDENRTEVLIRKKVEEEEEAEEEAAKKQIKYAKYVSVSFHFQCCFVTYIDCVYLNDVTNYHKTEGEKKRRHSKETEMNSTQGK
jgi:hypothetical protein